MSIELACLFSGNRPYKTHAVDRERDAGNTLCGRPFLGSEDGDIAKIDCKLCLRSLAAADIDDPEKPWAR